MSSRFTGPLKDSGQYPGREWFEDLPVQFNPDYVALFDDFDREALDSGTDHRWNEVKDSGASISIASDELGGILDISSAATTDNDGGLLQGNEIFQAQTGKSLWFESRVRLHDADDQDFFVGLSETAATNPENILTASNRIGFQVSEGDASILCKAESGDTETSKDSEIDASDLTWMKLGFRLYSTSHVWFYVNRVLVATITTNIPTALMAPAIFSLSGSASGTFVTSADYIGVWAER